MGGLLTYIYIMLDLPGTTWINETTFLWGLWLITLLGSLGGWGIGMFLQYIYNGR
jgi:hypothetical protein